MPCASNGAWRSFNMINLTSPREIQKLLSDHGLAPLKKFGQNFLCDENIITKIVDSMELTEESNVLEVGTGLGALTQALTERAYHVVSVEIDKGLAQIDRELFRKIPNATLVEGDILTFDIGELGKKYFGKQPFYVCGNLPYYITTPILMALLESGAPIISITAMVQKEVAQRLAAKPGDSAYGAITAACNYFTHPTVLFNVSKNCFLPAPEVDSAMIRLELTKPLDVNHALYTKVVRAAFSMRRKTIFNNLKQMVAANTLMLVLEQTGIDPGARAQDVSAEDFSSIAEALSKKIKL